jgi:glycosyltransferase involved in cell wall biosynthesis
MHPPADPGFEALRLKAESANAPLVSVQDRGPWDWRVVAQYLSLCRRERVAIWHGHDYKSNALGLLLRRFWRMHLVTTVHGWVKETRRTPLYYAVDRLCLPRYESVICVSEDLRDRALACGVPAQRCQLIENAIDTHNFSGKVDSATAKSRIGFSPDRLLIGAVGRLSAEKGFDVLIRAAHRLVQGGHNIEVVIAGDGDAEQSLRALIRELGMDGRVRLLGYCADTRAVYDALDLFVLSSLREGQPNVVLEALAMEVPVVATRVAGLPRLIQDGENGVLVEPGSVENLTEGMSKLLGDTGTCTRLAKAGRKTVLDHYDFAARMQKIRAIYDGLMGQN